MFTYSLKMIKTDRNLSALWQLVFQNIISKLLHLLALLCELFINVMTWINLKNAQRISSPVFQFLTGVNMNIFVLAWPIMELFRIYFWASLVAISNGAAV